MTMRGQLLAAKHRHVVAAASSVLAAAGQLTTESVVLSPFQPCAHRTRRADRAEALMNGPGLTIALPRSAAASAPPWTDSQSREYAINLVNDLRWRRAGPKLND